MDKDDNGKLGLERNKGFNTAAVSCDFSIIELIAKQSHYYVPNLIITQLQW